MPQDRRTRKFKEDRKHRMDLPTGQLAEEESKFIEPTTKNVIPDNCIWCNFVLNGAQVICPHCNNCQSCGMYQPEGGLDMCYLCGNKVPESRIPEKLASFRHVAGKRGMQQKARPDIKFKSTRGRKRKA